MGNILLLTFSKPHSGMNITVFDKFNEICSYRSTSQYVSIGSGEAMMTHLNDEYIHHKASQSLTHRSEISGGHDDPLPHLYISHSRVLWADFNKKYGESRNRYFVMVSSSCSLTCLVCKLRSQFVLDWLNRDDSNSMKASSIFSSSSNPVEPKNNRHKASLLQ